MSGKQDLANLVYLHSDDFVFLLKKLLVPTQGKKRIHAIETKHFGASTFQSKCVCVCVCVICVFCFFCLFGRFVLFSLV